MRVHTQLAAATLGCAAILSSLAAPAIADSSAPNNKLKPSVMASGEGSSARPVALDGWQEVPGPGDPDGHGTFEYTIKNYRLCYKLSVGDIDEVHAAHIHFGHSAMSGAVAVPLKTPNANGFSKGCIHAKEVRNTSDVLTRWELLDIKHHASHYYVNVHTGLHPAGAIRGQF
ncbi:CHRD domain-containing protein [Streptomyces sp. NPDC093982]|uniref:CHRD domain-containing protein n=1 Tax=Streptomyces sp. NPDC093982 TaxID=3155077 RepID=UPI0034345203